MNLSGAHANQECGCQISLLNKLQPANYSFCLLFVIDDYKAAFFELQEQLTRLQLENDEFKAEIDVLRTENAELRAVLVGMFF